MKAPKDIDKLASAMHDAAIRYANGHTVDFQHEAREFAQMRGAAEPVAWLVDIPDEPELGHWFAEESAPEGYRSRPLYTAPAAQQAQGEAEVSTADQVMADCEAFESAMVAAGYNRPDLGKYIGMYRYQRDQDRYAGWKLARAASPAGHDATGADIDRMDWLEAHCEAGMGMTGVLSFEGPRQAMFVRFPIIELDIDAATRGEATLRNSIDALRRRSRDE